MLQLRDPIMCLRDRVAFYEVFPVEFDAVNDSSTPISDG
jgi:hypothetical protein